MDQMRSAVVVEDEPDIRSLIVEVLEQAGFRVASAATGAEGLRLVEETQPLITTLDISMPGMDGFETVRRLRGISSSYVIMLTARTEEIDALHGLQAGADDYITKPFRPRELRARVEAMLRRPRDLQMGSIIVPTLQTSGGDDTIEHRGLRLNAAARTATVDGAAVELTRSEFDILLELLGADGRVVSKESLALALRGERLTGGVDYIGESDIRGIEVHVANLRRKVGDSPIRPRWIETVRGIGYRLTAP